MTSTDSVRFDCNVEFWATAAPAYKSILWATLWEENAMKGTTAPISLAGSHPNEVRHVSAFFNSDEDEYRLLLPFIRDGLKCGDKAVVNDVWRNHNDAVICTCHLDKSGGDAVVDVIGTHPMIIVGLLQRNPSFVPPETFLHEIRQRPAMRSSSSFTAA
jgi:hypothetical protein